jgi:hypothetical protein
MRHPERSASLPLHCPSRCALRYLRAIARPQLDRRSPWTKVRAENRSVRIATMRDHKAVRPTNARLAFARPLMPRDKKCSQQLRAVHHPGEGSGEARRCRRGRELLPARRALFPRHEGAGLGTFRECKVPATLRSGPFMITRVKSSRNGNHRRGSKPTRKYTCRTAGLKAENPIGQHHPRHGRGQDKTRSGNMQTRSGDAPIEPPLAT